MLFPKAKHYDLLLSSEYQSLVKTPWLIREECLALGLDGSTQKDPVIIDEIQKIPELLNKFIQQVGEILKNLYKTLK